MTTISETIEISLREDREEAIKDGEVCANEKAAEACQAIAAHLAKWLEPPNKWAAFSEDGGGVTLVIRSLDTGRRVDYRISPDGENVSVIRIDENTNAFVDSEWAIDLLGLESYARWVNELPRQRVGG